MTLWSALTVSAGVLAGTRIPNHSANSSAGYPASSLAVARSANAELAEKTEIARENNAFCDDLGFSPQHAGHGRCMNGLEGFASSKRKGKTQPPPDFSELCRLHRQVIGAGIEALGLKLDEQLPELERFPTKWIPVRRRKHVNSRESRA